MKTVSIIEGFTGGPLLTRPLRKSLQDAGLKVIKDSLSADIVIAHSAGIYAVPANTKAKLLLLIGPTYWPGKPLAERFIAHARSSSSYQRRVFGWQFFLRTKLGQLLYFFTRPRFLWLGIVNNNRLDALENLASHRDKKIIIVRNTQDNYCGPGIRDFCIKHPNIRYVELPGLHEDFVTKPKPYIDLLFEELDF